MADPGLIGFKNNPEGLGDRDWDWVSGREEEVEARHLGIQSACSIITVTSFLKNGHTDRQTYRQTRCEKTKDDRIKLKIGG